MARIEYFTIAQAMQTVIQSEPGLEDALVVIEEDGPMSTEQMPWVGIYIVDREDDGGPISGGTMQRFRVRYEIWHFQHAMESVKEALRLVTELISKVEIALIKNPTAGPRVASLRITRGDFESAHAEAGFVMAASSAVELLVVASSL